MPDEDRANFDPFAGSPAGAQVIAQFIPSTAAAYGLANPTTPLKRSKPRPT
jgi:soluble lytic murein transglycosylase-like protein